MFFEFLGEFMDFLTHSWLEQIAKLDKYTIYSPIIMVQASVGDMVGTYGSVHGFSRLGPPFTADPGLWVEVYPEPLAIELKIAVDKPDSPLYVWGDLG